MTKSTKITIIAIVLIIILAIGFVIPTGNLFAAAADNKNIKISFSGEYKKGNENKIKTMPQKRLYIDKINKQGVKKMKKKTLSILISVLLTLCLLFCFTGCRDDFTKVIIKIINPADGKRIRHGDSVTLSYTGDYINLDEVLDIKVCKARNEKVVKNAKPTITITQKIGYESIKTSIKDKGEYYVVVEWNMRSELTNYGFADVWFSLFVE